MGMRQTNQRIKGLGCLRKVKTHPKAEEVFLMVRKELPAITLATVYRNLNRLAEGGEILKMEIGGEYRYDADISFHQHCICKKCGEVKDLFQEEISKFCLNKIKMVGFDPDSVCVLFHGCCKKCVKK